MGGVEVSQPGSRAAPECRVCVRGGDQKQAVVMQVLRQHQSDRVRDPTSAAGRLDKSIQRDECQRTNERKERIVARILRVIDEKR